MIAVRKSIGLKNQSRQLATPGHVIFAYNIVQRCLSLLVWLLGVDYDLCTSCTAGSKGHRLSGSLLWVYVTISIFRGVGLIVSTRSMRADHRDTTTMGNA